MKKRFAWITVMVVFLLVSIAMTSVVFSKTETVLEFQVQDSVSKGWVWDMEATMQDTVLYGYFQSDTGLITYRFTNLKPGNSVLTIKAPSYEPVEMSIDLKRGINTLDEPISLVGYEIPGLAGFYAFETALSDEWEITLRPITSENVAILSHPALDIWVGARVYEWNTDLEPAVEELKQRQVLFTGPLEWTYDIYPETQFRYVASLSYADLAPHSGNTYVIEYLFLVPDPRKITTEEFEQVVEKVLSLEIEEIEGYIGTLNEAVSLYTDISWDVGR